MSRRPTSCEFYRGPLATLGRPALQFGTGAKQTTRNHRPKGMFPFLPQVAFRLVGGFSWMSATVTLEESVDIVHRLRLLAIGKVAMSDDLVRIVHDAANEIERLRRTEGHAELELTGMPRKYTG